MPKNIAQLLYLVATLLEYGRHLAATIEHRATRPGFSLFAALFGTANVRMIRAHLHRGILRATALEALLRRRAATGRDVEAAPLRARSAPDADAAVDPLYEPLDIQYARITAERARYDAPVDPDNLPGLEEIEAEVRNRPVGRTIAAIARDFGLVPGICTREFCDALLAAIACYDGSAAAWWDDMQRRPEQFRQEQEDDPDSEQMAREAGLYPHQTLGFRVGERPVDPFRDAPGRVTPRDDVAVSKQNAAAPAEATGPPPRAAMKLAA